MQLHLHMLELSTVKNLVLEGETDSHQKTPGKDPFFLDDKTEELARMVRYG